MEEQIIWRSGEKSEKTPKSQKPILNDKNEIINNIPVRGEYNDRKKTIINEQRIEEIMGRKMSVQTYQNPFFNKKFEDVLADQEKYLIVRDP